MRTIPDHPIPTLETPALTTWTLEVRTITPMFGGSAKTREVDSLDPVRPSSVRGHLRFWWRATAGAGFSSAVELFAAEAELWGSGENYGAVSLRVETISSGVLKTHSDFVSGFGDARGYALFPFDKNPRKSIKAANCLTDVKFCLSIVFPSAKRSEIENAVMAWIKFGGVGARTRRGCGSLEVTEHIPLRSLKREHQSLMTLLSNQYLIGQLQREPLQAWKSAVELYKNFRQGKDFARDPGSDPTKPAKLGRSRYPEPDTIRALSPRLNWTHPIKHPVRGYPRADLGLPIIFHFINEGSDHELKGMKDQQTRFASPIITKPVKVEGGYAPALIVLDAPHVWENGDLSINGAGVARAQIELTEAQRQQVAPLNGRPIREALLEYARTRGYTEVRL
jgi:CRISPR-associated protein Cmr1